MLDKSEMIFGVRAVIEAIQAGKEIDKILVKKDIQGTFCSFERFVDSGSACSGGAYQPYYPEESPRCGGVHFVCDLSEDGRPCSFLVRAGEESVFCDAGRSDGCA